MKNIYNQEIYNCAQQIARMSIEDFEAKRGKKGMNAAISVGTSDTHALVAFSGLECIGFVAVWEHNRFANPKLVESKIVEKNNDICGPIVVNLDYSLDDRIRELVNEKKELFQDEALYIEIKEFPGKIGIFRAMPKLRKKIEKYVTNIRRENFMDKLKWLAQTVESIQTETDLENGNKSCLANQIKNWKTKFAPSYPCTNCAEPHLITLFGRAADVFASKPSVGALRYLSTFKITKSMEIEPFERCEYCKIATSNEFQPNLVILTDPPNY